MVKTIDILGFPHVCELSAPTQSSTVLVFVHGWLLSRAYWQPIIQKLSPDYQCLSYDLRGFGNSQPRSQPSLTPPLPIPEIATVGAGDARAATAIDATIGAAIGAATDAATIAPEATPLPGYAPADYAQDLNLLLKKLNIHRAWLIGHSLGGTIALWAADQAPASIAGVICINSGGGIYIKQEFEKFRDVGKNLVKMRPRWLRHIPLLDLPMMRLNVAQPIARRWGAQRRSDWFAAQPEAALGALLDSTTEAQVHLLPQVVTRLTQPVHFIAGREDDVMQPKYVNHLASFHRSFEQCGKNVTEISNCGHLAMIEQPDAIASEIRNVLCQHAT